MGSFYVAFALQIFCMHVFRRGSVGLRCFNTSCCMRAREKHEDEPTPAASTRASGVLARRGAREPSGKSRARGTTEFFIYTCRATSHVCGVCTQRVGGECRNFLRGHRAESRAFADDVARAAGAAACRLVDTMCSSAATRHEASASHVKRTTRAKPSSATSSLMAPPPVLAFTQRTSCSRSWVSQWHHTRTLCLSASRLPSLGTGAHVYLSPSSRL